MTSDLDRNDLDDLLRSTLHGRADTVTSGPQWDGAPVRRARGPWLGIAAAAVTVLALAGGITALSSSSDNSADPAGKAAAVCRTTLPAAWRTALAAEPLVVGRGPVYVSSALGDGRLLGSFFDFMKAEHLVLVDGKAVRNLATIPAGRITTRTDHDGSYVVVSSAPKIPSDSPDSAVDEISVVNLATGKIRDVLADAPVPAGWAVAPGNSAGAVVQNGIVYVGVRSADGAGDRGEIITYTIRTGEYAVAAKTTATDAVLAHDVRGVTWRSGSVPATSRREGLPPFFDSTSLLQPLVSDGRAAAWAERDDPSVVHWTDGAGDDRSFHVQQADPIAVSGPFVVLRVDGSDNLLLDVRSGAVAPTTDESDLVTSGPGTLVFSKPSRGAVRVATGSLPGLRC